MSRSLVVAVLLSALAFAISHGSLRAQFVSPNSQTEAQQRQAANLAAARTQAFSAGYTTGITTAPTQPSSGGYGGGWGGWGGYTTPAQGFLDGVANVTNANAQYQVTIQQARMAQSQADLSKLDVRRAVRQEAAYERSQLPNPETVRRDDIRASIDRSRHNPPDGDIWSGVALNDLLIADQGFHRNGLHGPAIPIDPNLLQHINVTTGTTRGSVGALNGGAPLQWPFSIKRLPRLTEPREKLDKLAADLVRQAGSSQGVNTDTLQEALDVEQQMEDKMLTMVAELTPDQYTGSMRFLKQVKQGLRTLEDPNAGKFVSRQWAARGNTVGELVDELTRNGLKFAPAIAGSESFYTMLYASMITYDTALVRLSGGELRGLAATEVKVLPLAAWQHVASEQKIAQDISSLA